MKRLLLISLLCVPLWSCATYYATRDDVVSQVRSWEDTSDYGKIFNTLDKIKSDHPQYYQLQRMKPRLQEDARSYEKQIAREALALAQKQEWPLALNTFDTGLDHYPQSVYLTREREKFLEDREQYLNYLDRKYLYERADWLIRAIPRQEQIVDTNPEDRSQKKRLKKLQQLSKETAEQLASYGIEASKADKTGVAIRSLSLANDLQPSDEYSRLLKQLESRKKQPRATTKKKRPQKTDTAKKQKDSDSDELKQQFSYFEAAYAQKDWFEANDYLLEIERIAPNNKNTLEARKKLDEQISVYVQQQIKLGEHQYSQGDFTVALDTWEAVYPLAPDNKALNKYILRARRVLDSLKELSGRPPAIRFPVEDESPASQN